MKFVCTRLVQWFLGVVVLALAPAAPAYAITYPQLALGGGFQCVLLVSNRSGAAWQGTATLRQGNEQPWSTPWSLNGASRSGSSAFDISLPARATAKFVLGGDSSARAGYLGISGKTGFTDADVTTAFFYNLADTAGNLQDSIGVPAAQSGTSFLFPVEKSSSANTGFAFAPFLVTAPFEILATLRNAAGAELQTVTLTFNGHRALFFTEIFTNVPDGLTGLVQLEARESIFLTVLRLELIGGGVQLTSLPPQLLLQLESTAFEQGATIPIRYSCETEHVSPELHWTRPPAGTQRLALIMDDPDAPGGVFTHWVLANIPGEARQLAEALARTATLPNGARQGVPYFGPCPPPGPAHRYIFRLYALDAELNLSGGASRALVEAAMRGHILATAQLIGLYTISR